MAGLVCDLTDMVKSVVGAESVVRHGIRNIQGT